MRASLLLVVVVAVLPARALAESAPEPSTRVATPLRLVPPTPLLALAPAGDPGSGATEALSDPALAAQRAKLLRVHNVLRWATAASLVVTAGLGATVAINKPTILGDGRCASGDPLFGSYGCDSLSTVHGMAGVVSAVLYTATGVLGLATPGGSAFGHRDDEAWYGALDYVHLAGIVVQPVLGLLARFPEIVGAQNVTNFGRDVRSAHILIGDVTVIAYLLTVFLAEPE